MNALSKISSKAKIGKNVLIGDFTTIHDNVEIGDNTIIESNCVIGYPTKASSGNPLVIGANSHIRSHCIFYEGSTYGEGLTTGHFAFARENCRAGKGFQLGTSAVLDGYSNFGDYVKIHSLVNITEHSEIGSFVYFLPRVQSINDPFPPSPIIKGIKVRDLVVIAARALIYPGVTIGMGSFVAGGSHVKFDVPDAHCVAGNPAKTFATLDRYVIPEYGAYHPWIKRHMSKYPKEAHPVIEEKVKKLNELIEKTKRKVTS